MAKKPGGETSTPLVVALVFFVLSTLFLGVMTYFGYEGQTKLTGEVASANKDRDKFRDERDQERLVRLTHQIAIGNAGQTAQDDLAKDRGKFEAAYAEAVESLSKVTQRRGEGAKLSYSSKSGTAGASLASQPTLTLSQIVEQLEGQVNTARAQLEKQKLDFAAERQRLETQRSEEQAKAAGLSKDLTENQAKLQKEIENKPAVFAQLIARNNELTAINTELKTQLQALQETKDKEAKAAASAADILLQQKNRLQSQVPKKDLIELDRPKGRLTRIRGGQPKMVELDLGSADGINGGVTFTVHQAGATGRTASSQARKGAIEIASVLGPHASLARVIEVTNEYQNPLVAGDLLFNPTFNGSMRYRVVLAGAIDITGDGQDDTPEIMRTLERQGVVVDAFFDPRELVLKSRSGPAELSVNTDYLILGDAPAFDTGSLAAGEGGVQRRADITTKLSEFQTKAKELGVEVVSARKFLTLIGFRTPPARGPSRAEYSTPSGVTIVKPPAEKSNKTDDE